MDDRGEKIVNLAREMLRSQFSTEAPAVTEPNNGTSSFKAFCFTALLAAFGSAGVTLWISEQHRPINHYEKVELDALIFYTSKLKTLDETKLRNEVKNQFAVSALEELDVTEFRLARSYLQTKIH